MQKLLTAVVNIEKLKASSKGAFTVTDVEEINTMLHEGWTIQEWEFITAEDEGNKAVVLFILNDEMTEHEFEVTAFSTSEDTEPEESEELHDNDGDANEDEDSEQEDEIAEHVEDEPSRETSGDPRILRDAEGDRLAIYANN